MLFFLAFKIKMSPDLDYLSIYGTAGLFSTKLTDTYSALPLQFRKLFLVTPAVVLENNLYNLLISTDF